MEGPRGNLMVVTSTILGYYVNHGIKITIAALAQMASDHLMEQKKFGRMGLRDDLGLICTCQSTSAKVSDHYNSRYHKTWEEDNLPNQAQRDAYNKILEACIDAALAAAMPFVAVRMAKLKKARQDHENEMARGRRKRARLIKSEDS